MLDIEFHFSDFRWTSGILRPYLIEMHNARGITVFEYTKVSLNVPIDRSLFILPD